MIFQFVLINITKIQLKSTLSVAHSYTIVPEDLKNLKMSYIF